MLDFCMIDTIPRGKLGYGRLPTSLLSAAAFLENNGYSVEVYPQNMKLPSAKWYVFAPQVYEYMDLMQLARSLDNTIICGPFVTAAPEEAMSRIGFDFGIAGDPELPLLMFADGQMDFEDIPGFIYRSTNGICKRPSVDLPRGMFRVPAYHLWRGNWPNVVNVELIKEWKFSSRWVPRLASGRKRHDLFRKEIATLVELGAVGAVVMDSNFNCGNRKISRAISSLDQMNLWRCTMTGESVYLNNSGEMLSSSKCNLIQIDVGPASDPMLELTSRYPTHAMLKAIDSVRKFGIHVVAVATIGMPGETEDTLISAWEWLSSLSCDVFVKTFVALPGTCQYEDCYYFDRFGFMVSAIDPQDFYVDDYSTIYRLPWTSKTISDLTFLRIRNEMVAQFNKRRP